ncbi:13978_t:CDS:2, partial [Racocetra persica]
LVEEVKSQSGHNTPIEERSDPLPEKEKIASVVFRSSHTPQSNKCFGCGEAFPPKKAQGKLLCEEKKALVEAQNTEQLEK